MAETNENETRAPEGAQGAEGDATQANAAEPQQAPAPESSQSEITAAPGQEEWHFPEENEPRQVSPAPKAKRQPKPKAESKPAPTIKSTNKWSTRQLVVMALMTAISVLLSFVEFPLLPGVTWLKFDASAMPAMVCGFAFGPAGGVAVGVVSAVIHGLLMADFSGAIMNILVIAGLVMPAASLYNARRTFQNAVMGLTMSVCAATIMAIAGNLVITPMYLGVPIDAVIDMITPILVPFNLLKGIINAVLTMVVYKAVSNLITPKKQQVKGR